MAYTCKLKFIPPKSQFSLTVHVRCFQNKKNVIQSKIKFEAKHFHRSRYRCRFRRALQIKKNFIKGSSLCKGLRKEWNWTEDASELKLEQKYLPWPFRQKSEKS